jgi:hypothetical protein
MDKIADKSSAVNSSLAGKRNEIDKLVRVRRLLQRLEFVVVLPEKLAAAVAARDYASAVRRCVVSLLFVGFGCLLF